MVRVLVLVLVLELVVPLRLAVVILAALLLVVVGVVHGQVRVLAQWARTESCCRRLLLCAWVSRRT